MTFLEALSAGPLLLDGAMGSVLVSRGLPAGRPSAVWSIDRPDDVGRLTAEYVDAGARVVLTNTFCAAPAFVAELGYESGPLIEQAIEIALDASAGRTFVAASLSTARAAETTEPDLHAEYRRQCELFRAGGVDAIVIETMVSMEDLRQSVRAANAVRGDIPLVACMSFTSDLRSGDGTLPEEMAWVLEDLGADAVGVNCCDGPETVLRVVEALSRATDLPIWAKPNAGVPDAIGDDAFAGFAVRIVAAGASAIGGCCGTTPRTIRAIADRLYGHT